MFLMDGKNCKGIWWKRIGFRIRRKGYMIGLKS
jgi:hypothetical protein